MVQRGSVQFTCLSQSGTPLNVFLSLCVVIQLERYGELEQQLEAALRDVQQQQLHVRQREAEVGLG